MTQEIFTFPAPRAIRHIESLRDDLLKFRAKGRRSGYYPDTESEQLKSTSLQQRCVTTACRKLLTTLSEEELSETPEIRAAVTLIRSMASAPEDLYRLSTADIHQRLTLPRPLTIEPETETVFNL